MAEQPIETFEQFWDFYVGEHKEKGTRILHFIGTTAAMGCALGGLLTKRRWLLLAAPVVGYGPAWVSHFLIEKNKPASFKYPVWSLRADLLMWWKTVIGKMEDEVARVTRKEEEERVRAAAPPSEDAPLPREAVN